MRPHDKRERRLGAIEEQTRPRILRLIQDYYPPLLRARVLACCRKQQLGVFTMLCRHDYCPACSPRESYNRARRHLDTFRTFTPPGAKVRVAHEVYTLPPLLYSHVAAREGFAGWKRAVLATMRELHGFPVAGVAALHPMGDRDITKRHLHWDCLINGYRIDNGQVVRAEAARFKFEDGRRVYRQNLVREFGLDAERAPRLIDAWWDRKERSQGLIAYWSGEAKVWSKFRYSARNIYQPDKAWRVPEELAHEGKTWAYRPKPKEPTRYFRPDEVMPNLLAQKAWLRGLKRYVWFGYMADNQRRASLPLFQPSTPASEGGASS